MTHRTFGTGGRALSAVGLGCNNFGMLIDEAQTAAVVRTALDEGITHFDTAEMYGEGRSEEYLGAALAGRRDEAVVATKFLPRSSERFTPGDLAARVRQAAEQSLRRLRTDRIDVFYQHYPDAQAPADELLAVFDELISAGKVLDVAVSNVDAKQLASVTSAAADRRPDFPLRGLQVEWNLLSRAVEDEVVPAAAAAGLGVVPYFPLASGLLTGKYRGGAQPEGSRFAAMPYFAQVATPENVAAVERLAALAEARGRSLTELAFGWLLAQPSVASVIAGARTPDQVRANVAAAGWTLTPADLADVAQALAGTD